MFKYYQPNGKDIKDNMGDCVIRALTKATEKTWVEVFDELVPIARKKQQLLNSKEVYEEFLKNNGFIYRKISNKKGSKRPTVKSFCKENKNKCVLCLANHLVATQEGDYYDTWKCEEKHLYGYWEKI